MKRFALLLIMVLAMAGNAAALQIKQSLTEPLAVLLVDATDGYTAETGITSPDVQYSKNGSTNYNLPTPTFTEIAAGSMPGYYSLTITTDMTDQLGELVVYVNKTGCRSFRKIVEIVANLESDSYGIVNNGTYGNSALNTRLSSTLPVDMVKIDGAALGTHASGMVPADMRDIAGSAVSTTTAQIGCDARLLAGTAPGDALAQGIWNAATASYGSSGSYGLLVETDLDAAISTRSTLTASDNIGINWGDVSNPTTTVGLSGTTISTTQAVASVSGAVGSVTGAVGSVTGAVGSVTGNVTGSVGSVASGGITAASIATDAIGAAEIAADAGTELGTATWATTTRQLTALDEDATTIDLNASAVGSVAGAVGSVTGAVGSVTAGVTVTTNNDKTGYALSAAGIDSIWDEVQTGHTTASSFGKYLDAQVSTVGGGTAASIADAVWDEATSGHTTTGTTGKALIDAGAAGNPWSTDISTGYNGLAGEYVRSIYQGTNGTKDGVDYNGIEKMIRIHQ